MKKWYFSKDGKVSGPLNASEAKNLLAKNPDYYAWQPAFTQWQPVSELSEFCDVVPTPVPAAQIPEELIEEFVAKKKRLENKLISIYQRIDLTATALYEFEKEISIYKRLTHNLSDEVKNNITSIEQQYANLNKNLYSLKKVAEIAQNETDDIVTDFDNQVASKSTSKAKQVKQATTPTFEHVSENNETSNISQLHPDKKIKQEKNDVAEVKIPQTANIPSEEPQNTEKVGFSGVKNIFKSVFKGEEGSELTADDIPLTVPKDFTEPPALTIPNEAPISLHQEKPLEAELEESEAVVDEEEKARRMRRRRRRR